MEFYNSKDEKINLATIADVNSKMNNKTVMIRSLPTSFDDESFLFQVDKNITIQDEYIPVYSRGIFINSGESNDALLIAISPSKNIYIGFRNNGEWTSLRKI